MGADGGTCTSACPQMFASRAAHGRVNGTTAIPWRSSRRKPTLLEQLKGSECACFLVVRDSTTSVPSLLCVSAGGDNNEAVIDYFIKSTGTVFQLSESRLSFSDLAQLVLFYSLTRDVLAVCLSIPLWIYGVTENTRDLSQLKPGESFLSVISVSYPLTEVASEMQNQRLLFLRSLTSTNGALCIINPLYLREHGDDWLTNRTTSAQSATQSPTNYRKERRLSSTRLILLIAPRQHQKLQQALFSGGPAETLPPPLLHTGSNRASLELLPHGSPVPLSPHRVSWIEDGVWLPPPRPSSRLHPPSQELDSLSISSIEEEQEYQIPSPAPHHQSAHRLADKVIHRLSAVGQALGGLVSQKKRLTNRVQELSERKGSAFAEAVKGFVEMTLKKAGDHSGVTGSEFLQELSLHKVALKPVSAHLYSCIHTSRTNDGSFDRLQSNMSVLEKNGVEELGGSAGVGVPDSLTLERIQQRWTSMHEVYSPNKKVQTLLKVCKSIYHSMSANAISAFGADDFLPCLTWVLLRSDVVTLHLDTDYMMELLDPTQLQGEGGYYLTTLYASLYYISSFRPRLAARQLSVEAQNSLNQWHRRRTLHCNQSRRSRNRRTIRRQTCRDRGSQNSETGMRGERREVEETGSLLIITRRHSSRQNLRLCSRWMRKHTLLQTVTREMRSRANRKRDRVCVEKRTTDDWPLL
ncbi:hypothetical protein F7725_021090 [Dissostichus mawsoni]|uniref:VPS9 domain-containing protein n=1 Tax=Dissostichus mawsoni TaxID=36200 RepID=A0A7J5YF11_DISMA|nr:hypothetical protein F7725_021090 [Dissostichus mawsoni]